MHRVARGSAINLAGGAASAGATFAITMVLAQTLPTTQVGAFFTATSLFLLLTALGQLGTSTGLVYFLAGDGVRTGGATRTAYLRTALGPVLTLAALTGLTLLLAAPPLALWLGSGVDPGLVDAIRVLAGFTLFTALLNLFASASRGLGAMAPTALFDQVLRPVLQIGLVLLTVRSGEIVLVVLAWAFPYVPTALGAMWWWHARGPTGPQRAASSAVRREFWAFTAPRALAGVAQTATQRLDILLVAAMAGLRSAAIYAVVTRFLVLGQVAGLAFSRATQPSLARALAGHDRPDARHVYQVATCWLVLLVWPYYFVLVLGADHILGFLGSDYASGSNVLVLLALSMLVATQCGMVDVVLTMGGKTRWNLYNVLLALVVNIGLDLLLIPAHGIIGAAIGWSAAILCANLVPLAQVTFALRLHPYGAGTLRAMALAAACFGLLPALATRTLGDTLPALVGTLALATTLYAAALWLLRRQLDLDALLPGRNPS